MNQPFAIITVTNTSGRACTLDGYPTVTGAWTSKGPRPVRVLDSSIYEVQDPKPTLFSLAPGGNVWFAAGTGMGFESALVTFTQLAFSTDEQTGVDKGVRVRVELGSTREPGKPDGIIVTAFAPGKRPPT